MKEFYIKTEEHEGLYVKADQLDEIDDRLLFFRNEEIVAEVKFWRYWLEKYED